MEALLSQLSPLDERFHSLSRYLVADSGVALIRFIVRLDKLDYCVFCGVVGQKAPACALSIAHWLTVLELKSIPCSIPRSAFPSRSRSRRFAPELVGALGGWVGRVRLPFVVVALRSS